MADSTVLIVGVYGVVGSRIARHLRAAYPKLGLIVAGRNPERGAVLAGEIAAATARVDIADGDPLAAVDTVDLVIGSLQDPDDRLLDAAMRRGAGFVGIATGARELAPVVARALSARPRRAVIPMPYWMAGTLTWAALDAARAYDRVDAVRMAALYDYADPIGPMTQADAESFSHGPALVRHDGAWSRRASGESVRRVERHGREAFEAQAMNALDVVALGVATGAGEVTFHLGAGDTGAPGGEPPSHDLFVEIEGDKDGAALATRTTLSDANGQANLTALGVLIAAERVLGLDGEQALEGGLHLPETMIAPQAAVARLRAEGVRVSTVPR